MDYFFEIAIYRSTENKYNDELESEKLILFNERGLSLDDPPDSLENPLNFLTNTFGSHGTTIK